MKRIDIIYQKFKEIYCGEGISASEIADILNLSRANVSSDLNRLCNAGLLIKDKKKTVLFSLNHNMKKKQAIFDIFLKRNESLKIAVQQAKAAVLYPPNGMHMLILGETGVGKSMFAGIVSEYAIEIEKMENNAPFIVFNCADYANNSQLLISQIFGTKKGAYTGSDTDKVGLIEKANGGILFLDEVHRLPPEGQEMFFAFMDRGTFRRLGETELERKAKVLIISATTEDTNSVLLKTFTRRIPMIINIPSLENRNIEERFNLITQFFKEESSRLEKNIKVSINAIKSFLGYSCPNNIGQLKTDIQLSCAKAFLEFVSGQKKEVTINSMDLPQNIRQGLYLETEHRQLWNKLMDISNRYITFDNSDHEMILKKDSNNKDVYEMIEANVSKLRSTGVTTEELVEKMERDIENYFNSYIEDVNEKFDISTLESIIDTEIVKVISEILKFSEEALGRRVSEKVYYGMAVHIDHSIKRIKNKRGIVNTQLNQIRTSHKKEFNIALQCLEIIENRLDILVPIDEAGFIALFLAYNEHVKIEVSKVKIIVIAHGISTASSMVDTANKLLGVNHAIGVNAPIDEKPQETIIKLKKQVEDLKIRDDILFLVDMGSLTNLGEEIQKYMDINSRTIQLVSTLHVIEATRKAIMGFSLEEIYRSTIAINTLFDKDFIGGNIRKEETKEIKTNVEKEIVIVTVCTTGEGGAVAIKEFLHNKLKSKNVKIIPIGIFNTNNIIKNIKEIEESYRIVCIVTSFDIDIQLPQFGFDEVLNVNKMKNIEELVEIENTYIKIGETLEMQIKHINIKELIRDIKKFNDNIQEKINTRISASVLIGITMHIAYLIDKLDKIKETKAISNIDKKKVEYIKENLELYEVVEYECNRLGAKHGVNISDNEIFYIMKSFDSKSYKRNKMYPIE